ncbi:hypothetical protein L6164_030250 [Bauhinia variegata]|uniref:Uncharacterized protein n=1 Tax=Bauhinia variegata TaxID=167791 RepID=A0ACB9LBN9_BAUVA|nr:hypothetical protein L6164_030250 [Bauhinia variegata]
MKGVGCYNDWVYYSSSSSNLSAFAPPFSVNRSPSKDVSAPYADLAESADAIPSNQVPVDCGYGYHYFSNPVRELDSTPSSKAYGYSVSQIIDQPNTQLPHFNPAGVVFKDSFASDQCSNIVKASLVDGQPYYPSHNGSSSMAHNPWSPAAGYSTFDGSPCSDSTKIPSETGGYSSQKGGPWNQFAEFNQDKSKQVELGKSFCSMEANATGSFIEGNLVSKGCQDVNDSTNGEHSTNMLGWEKHHLPMITDQLDDKSFWWQTSKSVPVDFSRTSVQGSPLVSLETHHDPLLKSVGDSGNHNLSFTDSLKYLRQTDKPSWVDTGSSAPIAKSIYDLNVASGIADRDLGINNFSNKEPYPQPSLGQLDCFGLSELHTLLQRNDPVPTSSIRIAELSDKSISADAVEFTFKAEAPRGFQNPHVTQDKLTLSTHEALNSIAKSFDSVDRCNPAIDSPCWKGTPTGYASPFEASETLNPLYVKKTEEYFGSDLLWPQSFLLNTSNHVKISSGTSNNNQIDNEIDYQERKLADPPIKSPVMNFGSEDCNSDVAMDAGSCQCKASCYCGLQYLDDLSEVRENMVPPNKSINDCESRSSNTEQKVIGANKLTSQNNHDLCGGNGDARFNVNECSKYGTSHATGYALSSPSSVEDSPSEPQKSKASTPNMNVHLLIDTMHNLSELLLFHCLNNTCEFNERDHNVLKNVISNLDTCILKNAEQVIPVKKRPFPQPYTSKYARESAEAQQEVKNHHFMFGKHWNCADSFPIKDDSEMMKEDNMKKALKRILNENFNDEKGAESQSLLYKNLWLEAEAALCSTNYKARYNQVKIEMEKDSRKQRDNALGIEEPSKLEVLPTKQNSASRMNSDLKPDYSAHDWPILNTANVKEVKEPSYFKLSLDLNKPNTIEPEEKGSQKSDSCIQDSLVPDTNEDAEDDEASVLARFHVHKSGLGDSCISTANTEEVLNSEVCQALDSAKKLASGLTESQNLVNLSQGSLIDDKIKANDFEASVMARFHILQSRAESASSVCSEGQLLDGVGFASSGADCTFIGTASECKYLDVGMDPVMKHLTSCTTVDKSNLKEFHLDLKDNEEIQSPETCRFGNQLLTDDSDGSSSDWEDVKKEEFAGHNFKPRFY